MRRRWIKGYVYYCCKNCKAWYRAKDRNYKPTCKDNCAHDRWIESLEAMMNKTGPMYEKWRRATKAA